MTFFVLVCPKCKKAFSKEIREGNIRDKRIKHTECGKEAQMVNRSDKLRINNFIIIGESNDPLIATEASINYNRLTNKEPEGFFSFKSV